MPAIDYTPLVSAHYNADEALSSQSLEDAVASADITDVGSPRPPVIVGGALNGARGPCDGFIATSGTGFTRVPTGGGVWDTRQISPGLLTKCTLFGWCRIQAGHGATQEFASQCHLQSPANSRAWILRAVQDLGGGLEGPVIIGWDGSSFTLSSGFNYTAGIPHNEWYFLGMSWDFTVAGNGKFVGYIRVPSIGSASITIDPLPVSMFSHTALPILAIGVDSGNSSGGQGVEVDHITWMKGYAFADATEFGLFSASPVVYPSGFDMTAGPVAGGGGPSAFNYYYR